MMIPVTHQLRPLRKADSAFGVNGTNTVQRMTHPLPLSKELLRVGPNLTYLAISRKWTVFRENSVKFCNFARSLIHYLSIFQIPVLLSAFVDVLYVRNGEGSIPVGLFF